MVIPGWAKAGIGIIMASSAFVALLVAPVAQTRGQGSKDVGKSPREILTLQEIQELTSHTPVPVAPLVEGLAQRVDLILNQNKLILEQQQAILSTQRQVAVTAQMLTDMDGRVTRLEDREKGTSTDPINIARMQEWMDNRDNEAKWFFGILAGLLVSGFSLMMKYSSARVMSVLKHESKTTHDQNATLQTTMEDTRSISRETKDAAAAAEKAANSLNEKILAVGSRTGTLEHKEHDREQKEQEERNL